MWLLDRFSNPLWYKASRLDKKRRRIVATALCSYDFFREQAEKKLVGPAVAFLKENPARADGLPAGLNKRLVDEALLGLLRCCRHLPSDPGRRLPPQSVAALPELWATFVLADMNQSLQITEIGALDQVPYSQDPDEARAQVLARWAEILGVAGPEFADQVNAHGFAEAWDWFAGMYIADTLEGMAIIPDKMLFAQARRVSAAASPPRTRLIEQFIARTASAPL
ncbi:MAG: hypothetical protein M1404_07280 [Acidobacteria bacterium]|nr:hypothetical protein [Acidobacteriota bacterium]